MPPSLRRRRLSGQSCTAQRPRVHQVGCWSICIPFMIYLYSSIGCVWIQPRPPSTQCRPLLGRDRPLAGRPCVAFCHDVRLSLGRVRVRVVCSALSRPSMQSDGTCGIVLSANPSMKVLARAAHRHFLSRVGTRGYKLYSSLVRLHAIPTGPCLCQRSAGERGQKAGFSTRTRPRT